MKARLSMLTLSVALGVALAQDTPPNPAPQQAPQGTTPTNPQTNTQPDAKTDTTAGSASTALPEMKTMTFKGILIDMSCAKTSAGTETTPAAGAATQPSDTSKAPASDKSNTANRSASDSGASCPVSANSTEMGMKLDDGKTVRFDIVGNQRAQDALKNEKRWSKDLSANKPIHAKVSGVLNGDKLIVTSVH
jgi:hypothetical protein